MGWTQVIFGLGKKEANFPKLTKERTHNLQKFHNHFNMSHKVIVIIKFDWILISLNIIIKVCMSCLIWEEEAIALMSGLGKRNHMKRNRTKR